MVFWNVYASYKRFYLLLFYGIHAFFVHIRYLSQNRQKVNPIYSDPHFFFDSAEFSDSPLIKTSSVFG